MYTESLLLEHKFFFQLSTVGTTGQNALLFRKSDVVNKYVFEFQLSPTRSTPAIVRSTVSVPSPSTISSIKRSMSMRDTHANVLKQKHLVQMDWVSTEDGSHILTVGVGAKV